MKLLLDQNLSHRLIAGLQSDFPGSAHVRDVGLATALDIEIWQFARDNGFTIVSKDDDFEQLVLAKGAPPKAIWLHVGNVATAAIESLLLANRKIIQDFAKDLHQAVLTLP